MFTFVRLLVILSRQSREREESKLDTEEKSNMNRRELAFEKKGNFSGIKIDVSESREKHVNETPVNSRYLSCWRN